MKVAEVPLSAMLEPIEESIAALSVAGLSKTFDGITVLRDFGIRIDPGEIHVLVGENGSGKSTVIKILSGYYQPDPGGEVRIGGMPLDFKSPDEAYRAGCRFVHQDLGLVDEATVLDNLAMGFGYPSRLGTIRTRKAVAVAREQLRRVGLEVDPRIKVAELGAAERTGVAIARAIHVDLTYPARMLVLDEPTATLPVNEVDRLLEMLKEAARDGLGILFVTHHLDEVFRIGNRVTVLRDGVVVGTSPIEAITRPQLVEQLVGEGYEEVQATRFEQQMNTSSSLIVEDLAGGVLESVWFRVASGEVVGIAGLTGSGRESLLGAVFGSAPRSRGTVTVNGNRLEADRPDISIRAGVSFLPADRKKDGGFMSMTCCENLTIAGLKPLSKFMWLRGRLEQGEVDKWFKRLDVRPSNASEIVLSRLSGGNQQKVLLAKWMRLGPSVFLLDEPTQGVDIGAKAEVHRNLIALAESGAAIVVSSTDIEELLALCTRVLIIRRGRIAKVLSDDDISAGGIKNAILAEPVTATVGNDSAGVFTS